MKHTIYIFLIILLSCASAGMAQNKFTKVVKEGVGAFKEGRAPLTNLVSAKDSTSSKAKKTKSNIKELVLKDGSRYVGEAKGKKPHGKGKVFYVNGDVYEGDFVKGLRSGQGTYIFKDGEKYVGSFLEDRHHGNGTYFFADGRRYEGDWENDFQQGNGTMYYPNGDKYAGEWV